MTINVITLSCCIFGLILSFFIKIVNAVLIKFKFISDNKKGYSSKGKKQQILNDIIIQ